MLDILQVLVAKELLRKHMLY